MGTIAIYAGDGCPLAALFGEPAGSSMGRCVSSPISKHLPGFMHKWGTQDMNPMLDYLVNDHRLTDIIWPGHSVGALLVGLLKILLTEGRPPGMFRKRFETVVWPALLRIIQGHGQADPKVTPLLHHS